MKGEVRTALCMLCKHVGKWMHAFMLSYSSHYMEVSGQLHAPAS